MRIVCDTREQLPWFANTIRKKLDVGDYSIEGLENEICIERKTLQDLFQTLTYGHSRFKKELKRSFKLRYFAIIIEGTYSQMVNKLFTNSDKTQVTGHLIEKIINTIHIKYGIPVFFAHGRSEAKRICEGLFKSYLKIHCHGRS